MVDVIPLIPEEVKNLNRLLLDEALEVLVLAPTDAMKARYIVADQFDLLVSNLNILRKGDCIC